MSKRRNEFFEKVRCSAELQYYRKYPYTVCMAVHDEIAGIGFSKANPIDKWDSSLGRDIALGRAISDIWRQVEEGGDVECCSCVEKTDKD